MYVIKVDGELLYSPERIDDGYKVIAPKLHLEVDAAGSLEFTLPPCNVMYDAIHKMKSIITVEQDGEVIFSGRATEEIIDMYRQKEIYCEGAMHFLLDTVQEPMTQNATPAMMYRLLLMQHNAQTDYAKQVSWGDASGLAAYEAAPFETQTYADTLTVIQALLLNVYGGHIIPRYDEYGSCSLDYLSEFTNECTQKIEFGVNLLDIDSQVNAAELCTVLIPLGATTDEGKPLTVADANDGSIYIENAELIAKYGRIVKTYTWDQVTDPSQLLTLGQEYMKGVGLSESLTVKAIDMHLVNGEIDKIRLGDKVQLAAPAHGLDKVSVCTAQDIDLQNAEQSEYTFGLPKPTAAGQIAAAAAQIEKSINDKHRWLTESDDALTIAVEKINLIGHRTTQLEIDVDAAEEAIELKANQTEVDVLGQRMSGAVVRIDAAEAAIELKAGQATVDSMGERLTTAELRIDGAESKISMKADKIDLQGYVTMEDFEAVEGWTKDFAGESISASNVVAGEGDFDTLVCGQLNGESPAWKGTTVLTGIGTINQSKRYLTLMTADGGSVTLDIVTDVSITPSSSYINYLGKS